MTDMTSTLPRLRRGARRRGAEFNVYFTAILVLALPFTAAAWARDMIRPAAATGRGPLARARAEADCMTPLIFSA